MKTIVAMRGQPRTYHLLKHHTRALLDRAYGDYDFYWVGRPSDTVSDLDIMEFWHQHRPQIIHVPAYRAPNWRHVNSQREQSFIDWHLGQMIDWSQVSQVVFIRPDVYYIPSLEGDAIINIEPMCISGWWIQDSQIESVSDFYCQAGADAAQLICARHEHEWPALADWIVKQQFDTSRYPRNDRLKKWGNYMSWSCRVIRPTHLPYQPPPDNILLNYDPEWDMMSREARQALCQQWQIDPRDYGIR